MQLDTLRWHCNSPENFRSLPFHHEAPAEAFALRMARRTYGRKGRVGALACTGYNPEGNLTEWSGFIGRPTGLHETTGHNVQFSIRLA